MKEKIYKNVNEISFYFFTVFAITHIITGLLVANQLYTKPAWLVSRLLDVPFFIASYTYIISFIKINLLEKNSQSHIFDILCLGIGVIITLALIIYDVAIPNQLPIT